MKVSRVKSRFGKIGSIVSVKYVTRGVNGGCGARQRFEIREAIHLAQTKGNKCLRGAVVLG